MSWLIVAVLSLTSLDPDAKEPFPFTPAQEAVEHHAYDVFQKGDRQAALALVEPLTQEAPDNPRGWRTLGRIYATLDRPADADRAFSKALELGIDPVRKPSTLALRGKVRLQLDQTLPAEVDARAALALDSKEPTAHVVLGSIELERDQIDFAEGDARAAVDAMPTAADGHFLLAVVLARKAENDRALEEVHTLRALGAQGPAVDKLEATLTPPAYLELAWKVPLSAALFLAVALFAFFIFGSLLSRAEIGRLAAVDVHLLRNEQKTGEWIVERLYGFVMWAGTILFYVSVPLMVILTLAVGAGLLWLLIQLPRIPVQLLLIALVMAVGGAWSIVRGLFLSSHKEEPGWRLLEADHPRLFAALREVSEVARSRMVDRVQLETDASIGVREAGGTLRVLFGRGERVLTLGFGALRGLTVSELKSILAHEYGHFAHGETRLGPVVGRIIGTLVNILQRMAGLGRAVLINPVYWYLRFYFKVYLSVSAGQSRRRELLADRAAAIGYGGDAFGRALTGVIANDAQFDRLAVELAVTLRHSGRPCHNLYRYLDDAAEATPAELRQRRLSEQFDREATAFDSHPPPAERIQRVAGIPAQRPPETEPASSLFNDREAVEMKLSATIVERLDRFFASRGVTPSAPLPTEPAAEAQLASSLAQYEDAIDIAAKDAAQGEPLVTLALERITSAAGANDRCLVRALTKVSEMRKGRGDRPGAQAAMEEALKRAETAPWCQPSDLTELRGLLEKTRVVVAG